MTRKTHHHRHEGRDVNVKRVVQAVLVLLVTWAVIHVGVWGLYRYWRGEDQRRDVSPSLVEAEAPVPPAPRLQVDPKEELDEYLSKQKQILSTYGWVSRGDGKVRIPIERAMELIVEREKR